MGKVRPPAPASVIALALAGRLTPEPFFGLHEKDAKKIYTSISENLDSAYLHLQHCNFAHSSTERQNRSECQSKKGQRVPSNVCAAMGKM